jgi:hypothetical protein
MTLSRSYQPRLRLTSFTTSSITGTSISTPTGRFTWASSMRPRAWNVAGNHWPKATPATMQRNTQSVSQRSNRLIDAATPSIRAARFAVASRWRIRLQPQRLAHGRNQPVADSVTHAQEGFQRLVEG